MEKFFFRTLHGMETEEQHMREAWEQGCIVLMILQLSKVIESREKLHDHEANLRV